MLSRVQACTWVCKRTCAVHTCMCRGLQAPCGWLVWQWGPKRQLQGHATQHGGRGLVCGFSISRTRGKGDKAAIVLNRQLKPSFLLTSQPP